MKQVINTALQYKVYGVCLAMPRNNFYFQFLDTQIHLLELGKLDRAFHSRNQSEYYASLIRYADGVFV